MSLPVEFSRNFALALLKRDHSSAISTTTVPSISNKRVKFAPDEQKATKETCDTSLSTANPLIPLMTGSFPTADPLMAGSLTPLPTPPLSAIPRDTHPWSREEHAAFHREATTVYRPYLVPPPPDKPPLMSAFADVPSLVASALYWLEILYLQFRSSSHVPLVAFFDIDDTIIVKGPKPLYDEMLHPDVYPIYEWCIRRHVEVRFITARHDTPSARGATESLLRDFRLRYQSLSLMPPALIPHIISKSAGKMYVGSNIPLLVVDDHGNDIPVDLKQPIRLEPVTAWEGPGGAALRRAVAKFKGNVRKGCYVILNIGNEITDLFSSTESKHAKRLTFMGEETACLLSGEAADDASLSIKLPSRPRIRWMSADYSNPNTNPIPVPLSIGHSVARQKPGILRERAKANGSQVASNADAKVMSGTISCSCTSSFPIAQIPDTIAGAATTTTLLTPKPIKPVAITGLTNL
jgi:hypothetical protein